MSVSICIFGASITWGAYDTEGGGWADRLKVYFFNQEDENYADVFNLGIGGETSGDLLKRMDSESEARKPDMIIISIGNNDSQFIISQGKSRTSIEEFRKNIEKIWEKASKYTKKIMFVGLTGVDEEKTQPIYWNSDKSYSNEAIRQYDLAVENFFKKKNFRYIGLKGILEAGDWEDGLHPNAKGHEKIFQKIKPEVIRMFEEIKRDKK